MEKSWYFATAYRESRTRSSDNSISMIFSDMAMGGFRFMFYRFKIVMYIDRRKTIFLTPYSQFET